MRKKAIKLSSNACRGGLMKETEEKLEDVEKRYLKARKRTKELYGKLLINYVKKVTGWSDDVIRKRLGSDGPAIIAMLMGLMQDDEAKELIVKTFLALTDEAWAAQKYIEKLGGKTDP